MMDEIEQKVRAHYHLGEEHQEKEESKDLKLTAKGGAKASDKADAQTGKSADKTGQA